MNFLMAGSLDDLIDNPCAKRDFGDDVRNEMRELRW
jgi:hypothetical protein